MQLNRRSNGKSGKENEHPLRIAGPGRGRVQETKSVAKRHGPQFIPKLKDKKIIIRLLSGGQPVTGTIEGYNPYEILIHTAKEQLLVFKHAIATIWTHNV
jgi:RNA chaperone Hfq